MADSRRMARPGTRSVQRGGHRPLAPKKSNTGIIIGGAAGGASLLIILVIALASGGTKAAAPAKQKEAEPVDVYALEEKGKQRCSEGLALIESCNFDSADKSKLRVDLQRGVTLITEGNGLLDRANQLSGNKYDTTKYGQALKLARGKLLELKQ